MADFTALQFKDYVILFMLSGLFIVSFIGFGVETAKNYGMSETLMKSESFDFTRLENQIIQTSNDAEKWSNSTKSDSLFVSLGGLFFNSLWGTGKLIWGSIGAFASIITDGAKSVLGIPALATGTILAILSILLIFALWRTIKTGE